MISVIIPVYNVAKYLRQCIESVRNQIYSDLEIILIDDGSTDESGLICDEYIEKDFRIKVLHKKNAGLSAARNSGIALATGEYVCFIDSDDYVAPEYCSLLLDAIIRNNADLSLCYEISFEDGYEPQTCPAPIPAEVIENHQQIVEHLNDFFRGHCCWAWNKMFKRELINKVAFKEGVIIEDIYYMAEMLQFINKAAWIPYRLYFYRQRSTSIIHTNPTKRNIEYINALRFEYETVKEYVSSSFNSKHGIRCINAIHQIYKEMNPSISNKQKEIFKVAKKTAWFILFDIDRTKLKYNIYLKYWLICFRISIGIF